MNYNLDFCEEYKYPKDVRIHFEEILTYINPDKVKSVILTGSTARGELSYKRINQDLSIFSDYEFIVVSKGPVDDRDYKRLSEAYSELEKKISQKNPLFHIDFTYISQDKLKRMQTRLWTYETKVNGIIIYGENVKEFIPDVNLENLYYKELNEIIIWRLWVLLLYLPSVWIKTKKCDGQSEILYKYVLCRNVLDLTTWLLPLEGVLIPSFSERIEHLRDNYAKMDCDITFGEDFPVFLEECLEGKLKLAFHSPLKDLYEKTIDYYLRACKYLLLKNRETVGKTDDEILWQVEKNSRKLFRDLRFKRQIYDVWLMLNSVKEKGLDSLIWLAYPKYGKILHLFYRMHLSFLFHLNDNDNKRDYNMSIAEKLLYELSLKSYNIEKMQFPQKWLIMRREIANFMITYFLNIKKQKAHIDRVLNREDVL